MNADDTRHPGNECPDSAAKLSRELNRCLGCRAKPCEKACPLGVSPPDFIAAAKTGDFAAAAAAIAAQLHIGEVHANCLPEDKLAHIRAYQAADVGIAMGGVGSDIAVDAADIALVDEKSRSCRTSSRSPSA